MKYLTILWLAAALACSNSSSSSQALPSEPALSRPSEAESPEQQRERMLGKIVARILQTEHLRRQSLDDSVSERAFKRYLERLDPGKMFLLQDHVGKLRRHVTEMDDQLEAGRLTLAHEGSDFLQKRVAVVESIIDKHLARPFDFTRDESLETDPEKMRFCGSEGELEERWRKVLKLEVLTRVARMEETAGALAEAEKKAAKDQAGGKGKKSDKNDPAKPDSADAAGAAAAQQAVKLQIPKTLPEREKKARAELAKAYAGRMARRAREESFDQVESFVNAVAGVYDPHTTYLRPIRKENFDIQMTGSLEGIGALLQEDDRYIAVVRIVPGSASWRQGELEAGDLILSVGEGNAEPVDVANMRIDDVVQLVRGKKGTVVTLTVQKPDDRVLVIPITRDVVKIEAAFAKGALLSHGAAPKKIGYINVPSFYGNTRSGPNSGVERRASADVRKLLEILGKKAVKSVILDLRGNGGGLLSDAQEMSGLFIESGPIVQTRSADGNREVLRDDDPGVSFSGRVVVLVDRFSASASEILAAALQDYGRAVVVGPGPTHGKGTVQVLVSLDELVQNADRQTLPLGVLKLTRQQFFRITGSSTQHRGVKPDVVLPDPYGYVELGERHLDFTIPWSSVEGLEYSAWPRRTWKPAELSARSRARQASNASFAQVEQRVALVRRQRDQTEEPLNMTAWRAKRDRQRAELDKVTSDRKDQPVRFTVEEIDYDRMAQKSARPKRPARGGKKQRRTGNDPEDRWLDNLTRDPWVEEAIFVLQDMSSAR